MNIEKILEQMHTALGTELLRKIQSGEATSADLNVARQFLKDNNIEAGPKGVEDLSHLADILPFDEHGEILNDKKQRKSS